MCHGGEELVLVAKGREEGRKGSSVMLVLGEVDG